MARTNIRILTLDDEFFEEYRDVIEYLDMAIEEAEGFINQFGCPVCDYKKYSDSTKPKLKLNRARRKIRILKDLFS